MRTKSYTASAKVNIHPMRRTPDVADLLK